MSIVITDEGAAIRITGLGRDEDKEVDFTKDDTSLTVDDTRVAISDGRSSHVIEYTDATTPSGPPSFSSAQDLRDYLNSLLPASGGGGGGDASAANQVTQIGLETTIAANTGTLAAVDFALETTQAQNGSTLTDIESNTSEAAESLDNLLTLQTKATIGDDNTVAASIVSVTLKAANADRKELLVDNNGAQTLYVKYGSTASLTSYAARLFPGDDIVIDNYTGIVTGIWDVADGFAMVTETT